MQLVSYKCAKVQKTALELMFGRLHNRISQRHSRDQFSTDVKMHSLIYGGYKRTLVTQIFKLNVRCVMTDLMLRGNAKERMHGFVA